MVDTAQSARREAQRAVRAIYEHLGRRKRFARRIDTFLDRIRSRTESGDPAGARCFGHWAREQLRPVLERFFDAVPSDRTDEAALHRFRIREKELRYSVELFAGAFSSSIQAKLYPTIEMIQERQAMCFLGAS